MHGTRKTFFCLIAACLLLSLKAQGQAMLTLKTPAAPNLSQDHVLYLIGYSHLDTEWRWSYPQVIREYLPDTLHQNFSFIRENIPIISLTGLVPTVTR